MQTFMLKHLHKLLCAGKRECMNAIIAVQILLARECRKLRLLGCFTIVEWFILKIHCKHVRLM